MRQDIYWERCDAETYVVASLSTEASVKVARMLNDALKVDIHRYRVRRPGAPGDHYICIRIHPDEWDQRDALMTEAEAALDAFLAANPEPPVASVDGEG